MFGPPGHAYVYPIHARYCLNAVTQPAGTASAVLIRAVEPLEGIDAMARRRGTDKPLNLCRGPARLCEAFSINRALDGWDLTRAERLWIAQGKSPALEQIATSPRIGVTSAHDLPLRFFLQDCRYVCRAPKRQY